MPPHLCNADLPQSLLTLMEGPTPPDDYMSNGCTMSPDLVGGTDLRPACHYHDYAYGIGGNERRREEVDRIFKRNLRRCGASAWFAGIYYRRVALNGVWYFTFSEPLSAWAKLRIMWRCLFLRVLWF